MDTHRFEVRQISKQIQAFHTAQQPFTIYHETSYSSRPPPNPRAVVHTSHLTRILDVNKSSSFAMVEPNVPMDALLKATLKRGLMPPVVPMFPGLTVGGCFAGTAASSASFRHGFFDRAVAWVEVVLPDGRITRASHSRNAELLFALVGSLGTIAVATLLQLKLVPAARYVELTYLPVHTAAEALVVMQKLAKDGEIDAIEGLIYGRKACTYGVVAVGRFAKKKQHSRVTFSKPNDDWFYQHALAAGHFRKTESVPIADYLFRYDRGTFCMGRYCFGRMSFNKWTRWFTDRATRSRALMQTSQELGWEKHFVVQELVVPAEGAEDMLVRLEHGVGIYPVHLTLVRRWPEEAMVMRPNPLSTTLSVNLGIRGYTHGTLHDDVAFREKHRQLEHDVQRLGGFKALHSENCYTEGEFWRVYDREVYEEVRRNHGADSLQSVFEKSGCGQEKGRRPKKSKNKIGFWANVFKRTGVLAVGEKEGAEKE